MSPFAHLAAVLCIATASTACAKTEKASIDRVVLVSIDSLRADHVGAFGYPKPTTPVIDALARRGATFTRAYSTTSWTLPSHAALFTGLDDAVHGVETPRQRLAADVQTLAETLRSAGVRTTGFFSGPYLHPAFGLGQGFDEYVNCSGVTPEQTSTRGARRTLVSSLGDVTNPILLEKIEHWLEAQRADERQLLFIHMWDVHFDYIAPQRYVDQFDPDYAGPLRMQGFIRNEQISPEMAPRDLRHVIAQYDAEIRYTDETLGRILEKLEAAGMMERTVVIVLADHGDEFFEHGQKGHKKTLYEEVLRVPLVIVHPDRDEPARVDSIVSLIDVFPTICEWMEVECPDDLSGSSLVPLIDEHREGWREEALAELHGSPFGPQTALVDADGKAIQWREQGLTQYFDPAALAGEQRALRIDTHQPARVPPEATTVRRLFTRMRALESRRRVASDAEPPALDPAVEEQLRSLGYAE